MSTPKYHRYFALFLINVLLQAISCSKFFADVQAQPETSTTPTQTLPGGVMGNDPIKKCYSPVDAISVSPKFLMFVPQISAHQENFFLKDNLFLPKYSQNFVPLKRSEIIQLELPSNGYFQRHISEKEYSWEFITERKFVYSCTGGGRR